MAGSENTVPSDFADADGPHGSAGGPGGLPIGEICRLAGCTARTVRFYEERGIISPSSITTGGQKRYEESASAVIRAVSVLREAGLSLADASALLDERKSDETSARRLTLSLRGSLRDVSSALAKKRSAIDAACSAIEALLDETRGCEKCGSADCADCGRLAKLRTLGIVSPNELQTD